MASKITGLDETLNALHQLPDAMAKRVVDGAGRAGGRVLRKEIISRVPLVKEASITNPDGSIKKSYLARKARFGRLRNNIVVTKIKGAVGRFTIHTSRAFWAKFLEFGTKKRNRLQPTPFFRPAVDSATEPAIAAVAKGLADGLVREARKLYRRAAGVS